MNCTLMHKNVLVVDVEINELGYIDKIGTLHNPAHLSVGSLFIRETGEIE